jgi:hypothetical protein
MKKLLTKSAFNLLSSLAMIGAAALISKSIDKGYKVTTGHMPPKNPEADNTPMRNVVLYTAITVAATVTAQILVTKVLTSQWKKHHGELPEHLK